MELSWLALLGLSVGLAMDAFAVAVAAGIAVDAVTPRHVFRLGFHFGLFQFLMPIVGWLAGSQLATYIQSCDHWLAFALLGYVGGKMLWEASHEREPGTSIDPTRGLRMLTLSVATSIDALAVGMSMAFMGVSVWLPSVVIGVVTATLTSIGIQFGGRIGSRWGRWAEVVGGIVLVAIGLKVLIGHLFGSTGF
jgi:manganese efflux pump family protein